MMTCSGCGSAADPSCPQPSSCEQCPPETCGECGGINHLAADRMCSCWVSLADMPLANLKALFARDGTFSIDLNRTNGEPDR